MSDAKSYATDADVNAALYSAADLAIGGNGTLAVHGNGNDGIASKDGLVIESGTLTVDAVGDGIRGKDYLVVNSGKVKVSAGGDGLKARARWHAITATLRSVARTAGTQEGKRNATEAPQRIGA